MRCMLGVKRRQILIPSSIMLLAMMLLGGCTLGAGALRDNRPAYNEAIQRTEKQELFLNIVRSRYGEPLKFVQVSSVVSSFQYSTGLNLNASLPQSTSKEFSLVNTYGVDAGINYAEIPTVTYIPLEGEQFATQMLQASSVQTLLLLLRSGWDIKQVSSIMIKRINALSNDPDLPSFASFAQLLDVLSTMQARGDLRFVSVLRADEILAENLPPNALDIKAFGSEAGLSLLLFPDGKGTFQLLLAGNPEIVMQLTYANDEEAKLVAQLLGVPSTRPPGELTEQLAFIDAAGLPLEKVNFLHPVTKLSVVTRSFLDQLYYISHSVPVGPGDEPIAPASDPTITEAFTVHASGSRPDDPFVAVQHRGHWFYVDNKDHASKATFNLLLMIASLQTTRGGAAPSLTLPIGGG